MVSVAVALSVREVLPWPRLLRICGFCVLIVAICLDYLPEKVSAQEKNPYASDASAAKRGESQFRINCAFCHGLGARGGGRGPDLTRAQKKHGDSDTDLYHIINEGVPGTAMPANGTTGQGVGMTAEEVWQVITYIRSVEQKNMPKGDVANGDRLFHSGAACATCHMIRGKGGRLGPDLTSIGASRSVDALVESVRQPSKRLAWGVIESTKEFPQEYLSVDVETSDGEKFSGVVLNRDNFSLQMMDMRQQIHVFELDKLKRCDFSNVSRMPEYNRSQLSDRELEDIVAYLVSVSAK
jgi:cytochrome c oxidase cbb3-type subunit III